VNKQSRRVLLGLMALTDSERQEVEAELEKFKRGDINKRKDLRESFRSAEQMDLGPAGSGCPCCGK